MNVRAPADLECRNDSISILGSRRMGFSACEGIIRDGVDGYWCTVLFQLSAHFFVTLHSFYQAAFKEIIPASDELIQSCALHNDFCGLCGVVKQVSSR